MKDVREAAERLGNECDASYWRGDSIHDPGKDGPMVARACLAETDATSAPLAICLAALKAVRGDMGQSGA